MDTLPRNWHTTTNEQQADEAAQLRARLATAESLLAAEKRRSILLERGLQASFIDHLTPRVPERLENSVEAIADVLVDQIVAGVVYDDLGVDGHIESWAEERR
ncbi:hypothetical protein [Glycomyces sp. NPDC021274]|uniref:hypothetical protein n=1 Tax=Glycomyces sp. NPDC021274 TaxID=3155120 RepID=UPI003410C7C9